MAAFATCASVALACAAFAPECMAGQARRPGNAPLRLPDELEHIVFANRKGYADGHWYANIGYFCDDARPARAGNGKPAAGRLCLLDVRTGKVKVLLDAGGGSVRDPTVHYDARKVLFSWRKEGSDCYKLHEIGVDGEGPRQITTGPYDDIEPTYLPDGDIIFVSTRCRRWVNCYKTQVGTLFRCRGDGSGIRPISTNIEHDNTPSVLPDGRVLFTRWEYVDRSQIGYHHLWVMNPDGTGQMVFYGNQRHFPLYIDALPVPGTRKVVGIDSPGHGRNNHRGWVTIFDPSRGPNAPEGLRRITRKGEKPVYCDPFPLEGGVFLAARGREIVLLDDKGTCRTLHRSKEDCHEPRPVLPRPREPVVPDRTDERLAHGHLLLSDVYAGRSMAGVKRGEVQKLLVLESLPQPASFSGGPDLISWLGTFTLERVLGTVPVEPDGSAYFEVPANRPVYFVALDGDDMSVKRMQSFTSVAPGEVTGCVGCHERRTSSPSARPRGPAMAARRPPSRIEPFEGLPDVLDFNRDVQPILDRHCVRCHDSKKHSASVVLEGDLATKHSISYYTLIARLQVADGRNGYGNQPPRTIGSSASRLMRKIDGSHNKVKLTPREWRTVWLWLESGAVYAGSYAALRNEKEMALANSAAKLAHAEAGSVLRRVCTRCHGKGKLPRVPFGHGRDDNRGIKRPLAKHERRVIENDPLARFSAHVMMNFSRPERSRIILAPLAKEAGGWGACGDVFRDHTNPDYVRMLKALQKGAETANSIPRFATPGFRPNAQYIREMVRYGVLPEGTDPATQPHDGFTLDRMYWRSFWPEGRAGAPDTTSAVR
ncbi:MAG: HzsA-related protein [Planctomycetota bacterium]